MNESEISDLKMLINNFIWMYGPAKWTLEKAEEVAIKVLGLLAETNDFQSCATPDKPWYTEDEARKMICAELDRRQFNPVREPGMHDLSTYSAWMTKHLNLAFEKGRQIGRGERDA